MFPKRGSVDKSTQMLIALSLGAFAVGACVVAILVVRRGVEFFMALLGALSFMVATRGLLGLAQQMPTARTVIFSILFSIACAVGGYALTSALLELLVRPSPPPQRTAAEPVAPADGLRPVVLLSACVEPEEYDPRTAARELRRLADDGILSLTLGVTPFLFAANKARYRAVGGTSPALRELTKLAEELEVALGDDVETVVPATCEGPLSLPRRVAALVESGFRRLVVAELAVAESPSLDGCKLAVDALRLDELGAQISYAEPLWGSDRIAASVIAEIDKHIDDPTSTGIVLVMHGLPESRGSRFPRMGEQETAFVSRLQMLLAERGIAGTNVRTAYAEWEQPEVPAAVRHLSALGCSRVLIVPAVYPTDCIATQLDMSMMGRQARVDDLPVIVLPPWRDTEAVLGALGDRVATALKETGGTLERT